MGRVLGSLNAYRILVAEDDNDFLAALAALLEADGRFDVAGRASTGCEAVALARELKLDAIVMDIEMPVMDGVAATQQLQAEQPDLPVVAVSGSEYEERVLEIRAAGAVDYVRKSRVADDLVETLMAVLE